MLAARFFLFTSRITDAQSICEKLLSSRSSKDVGTSTTFELEAMTILHWCTLAEIELLGSMDSSSERQLLEIYESYRDRQSRNAISSDLYDADLLMVWAHSRLILNRRNDVMNIFNQVN